MKASINDTLVAESVTTQFVEGNHYFPKKSVKLELFQKSQTPYTCPWKGVATYWNVMINDQLIEDAAWSYEDPSEAASNIKSHIAFDKKKVTIAE